MKHLIELYYAKLEPHFTMFTSEDGKALLAVKHRFNVNISLNPKHYDKDGLLVRVDSDYRLHGAPTIIAGKPLLELFHDIRDPAFNPDDDIALIMSICSASP